MNLIAMAFIALGYAAFYWGANQIKHWNKSVEDTEAATFKLLMGFPMPSDYKTIHPIPFVFTPPETTGTTGTPTNNGTGGTKTPGGAELSPNFPGGPGATIPTPSIPGVKTA